MSSLKGATREAQLATITLIHNARAGIQPIAAPTVLALLARAGYRGRYVPAKRTANLTVALGRRSQLVAVAGGDGTVADVLRAGRDLPLSVAILPSGVANNIAQSLRIGGAALPGVVAAWRASRPQPVNLATVAVDGMEQLMVESVGLGALAAATRTMPHRKTSSFARAHALSQTRRHYRDAIAAAPPMKRLTIDGEPSASRPIFAEILNIPLSGPNLPLADGVALGDSHIAIVYGTEAHRGPLVDWLDAGALAATRPGLPTVTAKAVTVEWAGGPLRIDDEVTDITKGRLTVTSRPARIRVLVPH